MTQSLDQLFEFAEQYGRITVFGDKKQKGLYKVDIDFETIPGVQLTASSDYKLTIKNALMQAIERAEKIVSEVTKKDFKKLE